ncbi:MAG: TonB-dependent receptor [Bacteroidales bacterium]
MLSKIFRLFIICILFPFSVVTAQKVSGKVFDNETNLPLVGANIVIIETGTGCTTDGNGEFILMNHKSGDYTFTVSYVGYTTIKQKLTIETSKNKLINFVLQPQLIESNPIVISSTRTKQHTNTIPARVQSINKTQIAFIASPSLDASLSYIPGVNINRTLGIFANKSIVTMRGLSGKDQSRTLVMIDGVPINKTDGGSVNWNLFNKDYVENIEVTKGPVSSLYGSNAMGGAINIITRKPTKKFEGSAELSYGTFNTRAININAGGIAFNKNNRSFYWMLSGFGTKSDGYIAQTDINITPYTVKSYLNEGGSNIKLGYKINTKQQIETNLTYYDDERGGGETVYEEKGNYTQHQTLHSRTSYKYTTEKTNITASIFYLRENYKAVNEYIKDGTYTLYDVDSKRTDAGISFCLSYKFNPKNTLTSGIDIKQGNVDAADIYYSSTDKINNKGKMNFAALFLQDEFEVIKDKLKIVGGLRFENANYFDGAFTIETPSTANDYMNIYQIQEIPTADYKAISPKLSLLYTINTKLKTYASYSIGFRPPTLDDMCRSGKIKGGFKVVNPYLKPETLNNYELGLTFMKENLQITPSVYYSTGNDFMYYVTTGDSVNQGFKVSPVFQCRNISKVEIYGFELGINYLLNTQISLFANYAYSHSQIKEYQLQNPLTDLDITNKFLTDVPNHSFSLGCLWKNKILNTSINARYIGTKWVNDANIPDDKYGLDAKYPAYFLIDLTLRKQILSFIETRLSIENIFDKMIYDSKNLKAPGRFITFGLSFKY